MEKGRWGAVLLLEGQRPGNQIELGMAGRGLRDPECLKQSHTWGPRALITSSCPGPTSPSFCPDL